MVFSRGVFNTLWVSTMQGFCKNSSWVKAIFANNFSVAFWQGSKYVAELIVYSLIFHRKSIFKAAWELPSKKWIYDIILSRSWHRISVLLTSYTLLCAMVLVDKLELFWRSEWSSGAKDAPPLLQLSKNIGFTSMKIQVISIASRKVYINFIKKTAVVGWCHRKCRKWVFGK